MSTSGLLKTDEARELLASIRQVDAILTEKGLPTYMDLLTFITFTKDVLRTDPQTAKNVIEEAALLVRRVYDRVENPRA